MYTCIFFQAVSIFYSDDHWQKLSEMLEFSEMMLETWPQLALQLYLMFFYYAGIRTSSFSQILSLVKSIFILVPLTLKAIMPENTFTKNPQETWIIATKRMVWVTFLWLAMGITSIYALAMCIGNLEEPLSIWLLTYFVLICGFFVFMNYRESGHGRLKCYMVCVLFLQFGIFWPLIIIGKKLQVTSFKAFITETSDELPSVIVSTLIVVIFLKAAKIIKNVNGNIKFIEENPDYMILDDFEMISRVITSIGLKSNSKLPNIYFCSLIMMTFLLVIGTITSNFLSK